MYPPYDQEEQRSQLQPSEIDDYLAPIGTWFIEGIHVLSSKGFFISLAFFISLFSRVFPDAWIIQAAMLILTVLYFWVQTPDKASQKAIKQRRYTGLYILLGVLLINWDAAVLMAFSPVSFMGATFQLWQWLSFGVIIIVVMGLMFLAPAILPQEQKRYF